MKFKNNFADVLLLIATAFAIGLSIILWTTIMTSDQRFSHIDQQATTQTTKNRVSTKSLYDLYSPSSVYGYRKGKLCQLYDEKHNLSLEFINEFKTVNLATPTIVSTSTAKYREMLDNRNYLQLAYPDEVTFSLFDKKIKMKSGYKEFSRIFLSSSNRVIYFGNDKTKTVYRMEVSKANFNRLRKYANHASSAREVSLVQLRDGYSVYYKNSIKANVYSYLVTHQTSSYYVNRLLGTSGVSSKNNKNGSTTYTLSYYNRLKTPAKGSHIYTYTHYEKGNSSSATRRLENVVYYIRRIGLSEQDLHFFDSDGKTILYTNFVEGIPVFSTGDALQITTRYTSEAVKIAFNNTNLQIPIPYDGESVTLPDTASVISALTNRGISQNSIQKIVVGFEEQRDNNRKNLIDLVPTYYIKIYGEWKSFDGWKDALNDSYSITNSEGTK
ncbi:YycH family regulatory protein [Lactobacillus corticis]|uniref:Regulatory protein YycH domain-containing protein n=1 Tax=Lactobacillus corticis TaxID=2201249 RepID=A0A916VIM4_9LACO|nr:hypothetical protein [Lactobacillus corticis]GFZ27615.1 hypothetical protein LCB40_14950 [Lactobacillus corticis]